MTQLGQAYPTQRPTSNVFTVLIFVAFVVLAVAIGFVWFKHHQLFGTHPFTVEPAPQSTSRR